MRTSKDATEMLKFDLDNEQVTIRNYRDRSANATRSAKFAMAEQIRKLLMPEQDHQIDVTSASPLSRARKSSSSALVAKFPPDMRHRPRHARGCAQRFVGGPSRTAR